MNVHLNLESGYSVSVSWNGETVTLEEGSAMGTHLTISEAKVLATVLNEIVRTKENN